MDATKKPVTAEDMKRDNLNESHHLDIREMLKKYEDMWPGKLDEIIVINHHINLKKGS